MIELKKYLAMIPWWGWVAVAVVVAYVVYSMN